uniref:Uncharacterized protein n=1 Tax=Arion vulgaris TaxID=1028688 RepID=A0A0B7BNC2_9EUPU
MLRYSNIFQIFNTPMRNVNDCLLQFHSLEKKQLPITSVKHILKTPKVELIDKV